MPSPTRVMTADLVLDHCAGQGVTARAERGEAGGIRSCKPQFGDGMSNSPTARAPGRVGHAREERAVGQQALDGVGQALGSRCGTLSAFDAVGRRPRESIRRRSPRPADPLDIASSTAVGMPSLSPDATSTYGATNIRDRTISGTNSCCCFSAVQHHASPQPQPRSLRRAADSSPRSTACASSAPPTMFRRAAMPRALRRPIASTRWMRPFFGSMRLTAMQLRLAVPRQPGLRRARAGTARCRCRSA